MVALRELLAGHPLFSLGILLLVGFVIGKAAARVRLPDITGYIVAGLIVGESAMGLIPHEMGEGLSLVTEVALGLIAITIGGEFYWVKLRRMGRAVVVITLVQLIAAFAIVGIALSVAGMPVPFAFLLGAIASATAPAATVAIVQSLRAQGTFVDYLYGVVALDDAGAVILFGVTFAIVGSTFGGSGAEAHGAGEVILHAVSEVGFSVILGAAGGVLIHLFARRRSNGNEVLITTLGVLFMTTAFALAFRLSPLLTNMAAGAVIINLSPDNHRIFRILRPLSPPIYALFFVIAGTELRPEVFVDPAILTLGGIYILARAVGKYGGVWLGAQISGTTRAIRDNLGICMLPQAGVAIGLVLLIEASPITAALPPELAPLVATMVNIILLSVFVNELIGPPLSRWAIIRGNEMREVR